LYEWNKNNSGFFLDSWLTNHVTAEYIQNNGKFFDCKKTVLTEIGFI